MSQLKKEINDLLAVFRDLPEVKTAQRLKDIIASKPAYREKMAALLETQRELVRARNNGETSAIESLETEYAHQLRLLKSDPVVGKYLDALEKIDDKAQTVQDVINACLEE